MYSEFSKGRIQIQGKLTQEEVNDLVDKKDLELIQFSEDVEPITFQLLNDVLFAKRNDVVLRVFGFYSKECDLSFLAKLPNVSRFYVDCHENVKNLDAIANLKKLVELSIGIFELDTFEVLNTVPDTLEVIMLGQTKSKKPDLAVLERFTKLKTLYVEGHKKNIEVLGKLTYLEDVTLRSITTKNLDFLIPLKSLWSLDIKLGGITNFSALECMDTIKYLELWQIRGLSDISFISTLVSLQNLFLQSLPNVEVLPNLTNLKELRKITLENMKGLHDISSLEHAPSLTEFSHWSAMNMQVEDYIPLLKNPSLKRAAVGFGSDKRNNQFEELVKDYNIDNEILWYKFPYEK